MSQCANTGEDEDKSGLTDLTEVLITQLFISFSWRECSLMGINGSIQRFSRLATTPKVYPQGSSPNLLLFQLPILLFQALDKPSKPLTTARESIRASQVVLVVKNLPANARDTRDVYSVPGSRRSPGKGNGFSDFCLENFRGRRAWQNTVYGATKSRT